MNSLQMLVRWRWLDCNMEISLSPRWVSEVFGLTSKPFASASYLSRCWQPSCFDTEHCCFRKMPLLQSFGGWFVLEAPLGVGSFEKWPSVSMLSLAVPVQVNCSHSLAEKSSTDDDMKVRFHTDGLCVVPFTSFRTSFGCIVRLCQI